MIKKLRARLKLKSINQNYINNIKLILLLLLNAQGF